MLEKTLESPLDARSNQSILKEIIGKTDAEAEAPILCPPDVKNWLTRKDPDAGKDWRQEEKGMTEDEMVEWDHQLNGEEYNQALEIGDGQGSLGAAVHGVTKSWTRLSDWTTRTRCIIL